NSLLSPLTVKALGLPRVVGVTLFFGILRKELTLLLLANALGTMHINMVLTQSQILIFTTFVIFYIPCVSYLIVMWREFGSKYTLLSASLSLFVATLIGSLLRIISRILLWQ
ncbi:ferrous iron transport protein B, partial [bacterium]|nr:ferrous iron transport protein B [bacterium]